MSPRPVPALLAVVAVLAACAGDAVTPPGDADDLAADVTFTADGDAPEDAAADAAPDASADAPAMDAAPDPPDAPDAADDLTPPDDGAPDAAPDDAADAADGEASDAGDAGDAVAACRRDEDCAATPAVPVCNRVTGRCVGCLPTSDDCPLGRYCDPAAYQCAAGCRIQADCRAAAGGGPRTVCDVAAHRCVECTEDDHCPAGRLCRDHACVAGCTPSRPCPGDQACCGGACVDTATSATHCGRCGNACGGARGTPGCAMGACTLACMRPYGDCDRDVANGCETDTDTELSHCGACGRACAPANAIGLCASGACAVLACREPWADCDRDAANGCEANLPSSLAHCGACGRECTAPPGDVATCVAGACRVGCPAGLTVCAGTCVDAATDREHCGACGRRCPADNRCRAGTCVNDTFRVVSLSGSGCAAVEHDSYTGDDRGGIAASGTHVYYTGDSATARFTLDLGYTGSAGRRHDSFTGNLRDGTVYSLGSGSTPIDSGGTVTTLLELDGSTGAVTGRSVALSRAISATGTTGIFAGYDRVVLYTGGRVYSVALPSGAVTDLGAMSGFSYSGCESWAFWGVAEYFAGAVHLVYVQDYRTIVRRRVPDGSTTTVATFSNLSDMCSFTLSLARNRWYWHHEGSSQFRSGSEVLGSCPASWDQPP